MGWRRWLTAGCKLGVVCLLAAGLGQAWGGAAEARLPTVAVWQLTPLTGVEPSLMKPVTEVLEVSLQKTGRFTILARGEMEKIAKEQEVDLNRACDTTDCAVEYGQALSVEKIVVGSVSKLGPAYSVVLKLVDVGTGAQERGETRRRAGQEDVVADLVEEAAAALSGGGAAAPSAAPAATPAVVGPTVGDPVQGQNWTVPDLGMEFVWVPAMRIWVGKYEVTNAEYRAKDAVHDSQEYKGHSLNGDRQPVVCVSFDDATAYAAWLTQREQGAGRLPPGLRYRLPTKDEWTTFAQCGDNREYPWGNQWPPKAGNYAGEETRAPLGFPVTDGYNDGSVVSCAVDKSGANEWGLYGVGGNVWECTASAPGGGFDAWRGASWFVNVRDYLRCASRFGIDATGRDVSVGFRLVLSR